MSPENRIGYIELPARDIAATKRFYTSVFSWKFEDFGPGYASFHDGRLSGGFTTDGEAPARGLLLVIYAGDLGAAEARAKAAGGAIAKAAFSFPGGRRFHFLDPSGNELAIWSDRE